jgi:hypothetical protein
LFKKPLPRKIAEREIERRADLPPGSVVIHCPPVKGPTKIAKILIANADISQGNAERKVAMLDQISSIDPDVFSMHQEAIHALQEMYRSTWRFAVSVAPPFDADWKKVNVVIGAVLREMLTTAGGLPLENDRYTVMEIKALEAAIEQVDAREQVGTEKTADVKIDQLPVRVGQKMLARPEFRGLRADAEDREIDAAMALVTGPRKKGSGSDRQMSEDEVKTLLRDYLEISKLSRLQDPRLKALLTRVRHLNKLGVDTFRNEMFPHRPLLPISENEVKKQSDEKFLRLIRNAVTRAEEEEAAAEK